jgi:hypothetical protein
LDLQARYGTADGVTEVWGDWRGYVLFGGQGVVDPIDGNEILHGGAGSAILYGNAGNDVLCRDLGADTIIGGLGSDIIYADGLDIIIGLEEQDMVYWVELPYLWLIDSTLRIPRNVQLPLCCKREQHLFLR